MRITLQYFDDCPNWKTLDRRLRRLIAEGAIDAELDHVLIDGPEAAITHCFRGSPTMLVDGIDPFAAPDSPIGMSCRIYQTDAGTAGSPTYEQIRQVLDRSRP